MHTTFRYVISRRSVRAGLAVTTLRVISLPLTFFIPLPMPALAITDPVFLATAANFTAVAPVTPFAPTVVTWDREPIVTDHQCWGVCQWLSSSEVILHVCLDAYILNSPTPRMEFHRVNTNKLETSAFENLTSRRFTCWLYTKGSQGVEHRAT